MQVRKLNYDPDKHDIIHVLSVKQPFADALINGEYTIEIRNKNTSYRGDVLICTPKTPLYANLTKSGAMIGFIELYAVKPVSRLTAREWELTRVPREKQKQIKKGCAYIFRNARKVIELPVSAKKKKVIYFTKDTIMEYPKEIKITKECYKQLKQ